MADQLELDRRVAIKVLVADHKPVAARRFAREAKLIAKIESVHVCKVFDVGALESGEPYMVMEMLQGRDLHRVSRKSHRFSVGEVATYMIQAMEALAEAHIQGIVHRDLKPANLFLHRQPDGTRIVKVLDFGISKQTSDLTDLTQTTSILGSPRFIAPEQLRSSKGVDARADIWSLGITMYTLFTGHAAFQASSFNELAISILQDDPEPIDTFRADVPRGLQQAIRRCLAKDREDRFDNVAELALALAPFAKPACRAPLETILRIYDIPPLSAVPARRTTLPDSEVKPPQRSRPWLPALFAALVSSAALGLVTSRELGEDGSVVLVASPIVRGSEQLTGRPAPAVLPPKPPPLPQPLLSSTAKPTAKPPPCRGPSAFTRDSMGKYVLKKACR